MFLNRIPPIDSRRDDAPMTATLAGREEGTKRGHDSQVVAFVDVAEIRLGGLDREGDLERAAVELARDAEAGVLEDPKHRCVVRHHLGDEPLDAGCGRALRQLLEHARADPAALVLVGDGERDLCSGRVAEPRIACERDDALGAVVRQRPDERASLDPVRVEGGLDEGRPHGRRAVKAEVEAALREAAEELGQGLGVGGLRRPEPKRATVSQDDVDRPGSVGRKGGPGARRAPGPRGVRQRPARASEVSLADSCAGCALRTTLSAFVDAASAKVSYASSVSASSKRCVANGVGSSRPSAISLSSRGVVDVSTSPVVMVTSLIQSFSRWSVAGRPWTPTFATWPPGLTMSAQSSNVSGMPTASMATSTPRPSVSSMISLDCVDLAVVDGDVGSERPSMLESGVGDVESDDATGRVEACGHDRRQTDRAGPDDRDRVARDDSAVEDADLVGRGQDVCQEQRLLVGDLLRKLVG